ncbi:MAG: NUDIX hydrolase [Chloroflexi bacterium]|nr:NUDIX hydrolase [Chloroflexota bacterium]
MDSGATIPPKQDFQMPIEYLDSELIFQGRVFGLYKDRLRLPDGQIAGYDVIHHPGAITLIPIDPQGNLCFARQYRAAARGELLELPAGTLEPGEAPEACARREIREETGMAAGKLQKIGECFLAPGYSTEFMHFYLATELYASPLRGDDDEDITVERIPLQQVYAMAARGEIRDGKTLAGLLLARPHLESLQLLSEI